MTALSAKGTVRNTLNLTSAPHVFVFCNDRVVHLRLAGGEGRSLLSGR